MRPSRRPRSLAASTCPPFRWSLRPAADGLTIEYGKADAERDGCYASAAALLADWDAALAALSARAEARARWGSRHAVLGPDGFLEPIEGCEEEVKTAEVLDGVTAIPDQAFMGCIKLTSVAIAASVTSIGAQAFGDCIALSSVTIPDSVTFVGDGARATQHREHTAQRGIALPASLPERGAVGSGQHSRCPARTLPPGTDAARRRPSAGAWP